MLRDRLTIANQENDNIYVSAVCFQRFISWSVLGSRDAAFASLAKASIPGEVMHTDHGETIDRSAGETRFV